MAIELVDSSFDLVIDSKCFHCIIGEDRKTFLKEAARVLKKGGYLLIDSMCTPVKSGQIKGYERLDKSRHSLLRNNFQQPQTSYPPVAGLPPKTRMAAHHHDFTISMTSLQITCYDVKACQTNRLLNKKACLDQQKRW